VRLRVLTCNVEQNVFDPDKLAEVIRLNEPDVVALQEVKDLTRFIWPPGWKTLDHDKFLLASPYPIKEESSTFRVRNPVDLTAMRCTVSLPGGDVQIVNLHLRSPRDGLEAVLQNDPIAGAPKLEALIEVRSIESQAVSDWTRRASSVPQIVLGDFNMPAESAIFRRDWTWLADAFDTDGAGFGFTKITTIRGLTYGTRIDHVLYSPEWHCVNAWVGRDIGSDHLPLLAEFQ
jgi:endonuclease/exonuclease/phosphatase family metal-dependent hydrolase